MELDPQTLRAVWWKGALTAALKGIPQGVLLGVLGAAILIGGIYAVSAMGASGFAFELAKDFGSFLFSNSGTAALAATGATALPAFSFGALNILPLVALNTVLTAVGNFLTGGQIACNAYKQEVEHTMNERRISRIEAREQRLEHAVATSSGIKRIVAQGPRSQQSHANAAEADRTIAGTPTVH